MLNRTRINLGLIAGAACVLWLLSQRSHGDAPQRVVDSAQPAVASAAATTREAARPSPARTPTLVPAASKTPAVAVAVPAAAQPEAAEREHRPDDLSVDEKVARERERAELQARFELERPDGDARVVVRAQFAAALIERELSDASITELECRESMCRATLQSTGATALTPTQEVHGLIHAVRSFEQQSWLLASEPSRGQWQVDVFIAREGSALNGPMIVGTSVAQLISP